MSIPLPFNFNPGATTTVTAGSYTPATGKFAFVIPNEFQTTNFTIGGSTIIPINLLNNANASTTSLSVSLTNGSWTVSSTGNDATTNHTINTGQTAESLSNANAYTGTVAGPTTFTVTQGSADACAIRAHRIDSNKHAGFWVTEGVAVNGSFTYMEYDSA